MLKRSAWILFGTVLATGCGTHDPQYATCAPVQVHCLEMQDLCDLLMQHQMVPLNERIDSGLDVNAAFGSNEITMLHVAAFYENSIIIDYLALKGANPNAKDKVGNTPIHYLLLNGNQSDATVRVNRSTAIIELLDSGADPEIEGSNGMSAVELAFRLADHDAVDIFLFGRVQVVNAESIAKLSKLVGTCGGTDHQIEMINESLQVWTDDRSGDSGREGEEALPEEALDLMMNELDWDQETRKMLE